MKKRTYKDFDPNYIPEQPPEKLFKRGAKKEEPAHLTDMPPDAAEIRELRAEAEPVVVAPVKPKPIVVAKKESARHRMFFLMHTQQMGEHQGNPIPDYWDQMRAIMLDLIAEEGRKKAKARYFSIKRDIDVREKEYQDDKRERQERERLEKERSAALALRYRGNNNN